MLRVKLKADTRIVLKETAILKLFKQLDLNIRLSPQIIFL